MSSEESDSNSASSSDGGFDDGNFGDGNWRDGEEMLDESDSDRSSEDDRLAVTSVNIPEGTTAIVNNAFDGCENLITVTIPEGATSIAPCAFRACGKLSILIIPDTITFIGYEAFSGCSSLSVVIPETVVNIGYNAFKGCALEHSSLNRYLQSQAVSHREGGGHGQAGCWLGVQRRLGSVCGENWREESCVGRGRRGLFLHHSPFSSFIFMI